MTKSCKVVLQLLRKVLDKDYACQIATSSDWANIINVATEQGVLGVCFEAVERLSEDQRPDLDNLMEWLGQVEYQVTTYEQYEKTIKELAELFGKNDIKMLLLKGYGLSLNYPIANHRPCGDIDIFLYGKQNEGDRMIANKGIAIKTENSHHSTFVYNGISIENHRTLMDQYNHKSNIQLENLFQKMLKEDNGINIGENLYVPSPTLNAIYIVRHAGEHFATEKITLRHVLDLGTFFQKHSEEIDWDFVLKVYQEENMMDFYNAVATICTRDLGFHVSSFKGFQEVPELADRVLEDIFAPTEELPMSTSGINGAAKVKYGFKKSLRWWNNRWKYKMVYNESLLESFFTLTINRIRN